MTTQVSTSGPSAAMPRRSNGVVSNDAQERRLAWQREMERAQVSNWFKSDIAPRDGAVNPEAAHSARGVDSPQSKLQVDRPCVTVRRAPIANSAAPAFSSPKSASTAHHIPLGPASGQFVPAKLFPLSEEYESPALCSAPPVEPTGDGCSFAKAALDIATNRIEPIDSRRALSTASTKPPPVLRLHAEIRPEGQAVWIAMRANDDVLRATLPSVIADLQRALRERGERLHLVVCNGQPVWRDGIALTYDNNLFDSFHTREI